MSSKLALTAVLLFAAAVLVSEVGCSSGPKTGEVRGKVTFKGQPVKEGRVTFLNTKEGGAAEGNIQPDGTFACEGGVVVGEYVVTVTPLTVIVDTDPGKTPPTGVEKAAPDVPRKYRMQGSTPLKETVKEGKNEFNFDLKP
jgi:hypothetical protein